MGELEMWSGKLYIVTVTNWFLVATPIPSWASCRSGLLSHQGVTHACRSAIRFYRRWPRHLARLIACEVNVRSSLDSGLDVGDSIELELMLPGEWSVILLPRSSPRHIGPPLKLSVYL